MPEPQVSRADLLRGAQNADGGWGFFPGRQSWLEPTVYALLALHRDEAAADGCARGFGFVKATQLADGSWPANPLVKEPHSVTSLCLLAHSVRGVAGDGYRRGVEWLLGMRGAENKILFRIAHFLKPNTVELDSSLEAWPWRPGSTSWIEPTAHALVALRRAEAVTGDRRIRERIDQGEKMILERRCTDGGWNYGNRRVLGQSLTSYPETTAVALYGLRGAKADVVSALGLARKFFGETRSPLARAWLAVALGLWGERVALPDLSGAPHDVVVTALEAMALTGVLT